MGLRAAADIDFRGERVDDVTEFGAGFGNLGPEFVGVTRRVGF
ncbi:hypothetical protein [Cryptosporangium phraense]|nr:hypothetical protein [Cryptosporangium phraense]